MNIQTFNFINLVPDNMYVPMELNMYVLNSIIKYFKIFFIYINTQNYKCGPSLYKLNLEY
jgi:hypothetical protein